MLFSTPGESIFPRTALHETQRISRSASLAWRVTLHGEVLAGKSPIFSPDPDSKPAISRSPISTLIARGKHRDRKTRDKPITRPSRKNKPIIIPGQKEDLENKFV